MWHIESLTINGDPKVGAVTSFSVSYGTDKSKMQQIFENGGKTKVFYNIYTLSWLVLSKLMK